MPKKLIVLVLNFYSSFLFCKKERELEKREKERKKERERARERKKERKKERIGNEDTLRGIFRSRSANVFKVKEND